MWSSRSRSKSTFQSQKLHPKSTKNRMGRVIKTIRGKFGALTTSCPPFPDFLYNFPLYSRLFHPSKPGRPLWTTPTSLYRSRSLSFKDFLFSMLSVMSNALEKRVRPESQVRFFLLMIKIIMKLPKLKTCFIQNKRCM